MADRIRVSIPQETVNDESVRILSWQAPSGARVDEDQLICEAETSKAVMEIRSPAAGILMYRAAVGEEVPVGATICEILPEAEETAPVLPPVANNGNLAHMAPEDLTPARFTPLALKVAEEYGVDISSFAPGTLVRRSDVLRKAGRLPPEEVPVNGPAADKAPLKKNPGIAGVAVEWSDLPRRKVVEGGILAAGQATTVASSVTRICQAPNLRARAEKLGFPTVGFSALMVFETARLLRRYPVFNSVHEGNRIGRYQRINIGWAVDGGRRLVVPVIPQADEKSLAEIATAMQEHLEGYVSDSLPPAAFAGGTFTVTDLSADGVIFFQPLISQGQSAILGVGSDRSRKEGEIFYLTLTFDHQLAEGRTAAQFLGELRDRLEAHSALGESSPAGGVVSSRPELYCVLCQRDSTALRKIKAILLRSEIPDGFVCSLCIGGWL